MISIVGLVVQRTPTLEGVTRDPCELQPEKTWQPRAPAHRKKHNRVDAGLDNQEPSRFVNVELTDELLEFLLVLLLIEL